MSIIHNNLIENLYEAIIASLFFKSVDLTQGVIRLYEEELFENAQILIRVLFETNVNFGYFLKLKQDIGEEEACAKVWFGVFMTNIKNYQNQDAMKYWKNHRFLEKIEALFKSQELKSMRKHGFSGISLEERAKLTGKDIEYNIMYRNFSRNAHANDLIEYFKKIGFPEKQKSNNFLDRDLAAITHAFLELYQMTVFCNKSFGIQSDDLPTIEEEFNLL